MQKLHFDSIRAWYNQIYTLKGAKAMGNFNTYHIFLDYLNIKKGKKLLDIGCGAGILLKLAQEAGLDTFGIDISDRALKIAKEVSPNSTFLLAKAENLKFDDGTFDYIACIGSLEHFFDIQKSIKEMVRVAKEDAFFCIMVPNKDFIFRKIRSGWYYSKKHVHVKLFNFKQWKTILEKNGLEIIRIYPDRWFEMDFPKYPTAIKKIKNNLLRVFWFFLPLNYTHHFIFICKKCKYQN